MATILVTGANGNVASTTLRALKESGHKLVGLIRDRKKGKDLEAMGVELREGDLGQLRSVENLFEGVDTAFVAVAGSPLAPYHASNALWAARKGGVKHVVRLSAVGAAHDAPPMSCRLHALSDEELRRSGLAYTILQPHFFTQNLMGLTKSVADQGVMYFGLGDAKIPMIDVRDIAETAAVILANPSGHTGKTYTLTGGAAIGIADAAEQIGAALGKPVKYVPVAVAQVVETIAKNGGDDYRQVIMRDYLTAYGGGWQNAVSSDVKDITGHAPREFSVFAKEFAAAVKG